MLELYVCLCFIFLNDKKKKAEKQVINERKKERKTNKQAEFLSKIFFPVGLIFLTMVLLQDYVK